MLENWASRLIIVSCIRGNLLIKIAEGLCSGAGSVGLSKARRITDCMQDPFEMKSSSSLMEPLVPAGSLRQTPTTMLPLFKKQNKTKHVDAGLIFKEIILNPNQEPVFVFSDSQSKTTNL